MACILYLVATVSGHPIQPVEAEEGKEPSELGLEEPRCVVRAVLSRLQVARASKLSSSRHSLLAACSGVRLNTDDQMAVRVGWLTPAARF